MGFLRPDNSPLPLRMEDFIGNGTFGLVFREGAYARKIPKLYDTADESLEHRRSYEYTNKCNRDDIEREKAVYQRVGHCNGIPKCIEASDTGILLELLPNGDLEKYIGDQPEVDQATKMDWIESIITTVAHFHRAKVLLFDLALRNVLLTHDLSVKLIDFGSCAILAEDIDMTGADDDGLTVKVDLFHVGNLIYSIMTWKKFHRDVLEYKGELPPDDVPDASQLPNAELIENCWAGRYETADDLFENVKILRRPQDQSTGLIQTALRQTTRLYTLWISLFSGIKTSFSRLLGLFWGTYGSSK